MTKKEAWSKINAIAEEMLEDKTECRGCPFAYGEYNWTEESSYYLNEVIPTCTHNYNKFYDLNDMSRVNHAERPNNCPIRWRNK